MSDGLDVVHEYADTVASTVETENQLRADIARLTRERDQATLVVGELAALIPLSETIEATRTGATMVQWFKEHLRPARPTCHYAGPCDYQSAKAGAEGPHCVTCQCPAPNSSDSADGGT